MKLMLLFNIIKINLVLYLHTQHEACVVAKYNQNETHVVF